MCLCSSSNVTAFCRWNQRSNLNLFVHWTIEYNGRRNIHCIVPECDPSCWQLFSWFICHWWFTWLDALGSLTADDVGQLCIFNSKFNDLDFQHMGFSNFPYCLMMVVMLVSAWCPWLDVLHIRRINVPHEIFHIACQWQVGRIQFCISEHLL